MARTSLATYRKKRDFTLTAEPAGSLLRKGGLAGGRGDRRGGRFVVHEHHASRLHFDLRLEMGGVLKSWAVPKGPSLDPRDRRLAVLTEDHPLQYLTFQGTIADGQYGAGEMRIWDTGRYSTHKGEDALESWAKGKLHLDLEGGRLRGSFMLVRTAREDRSWLLFKLKDEAAVADWSPALILPYGSRREKPGNLEETEEAAPKTPEKSPERSPRKRTAARPKARSAPARRRWPAGAVPASLPPFVPPMLATLADAPFDDPDWVFETKWDGWRAQLRWDGESTRLISRSGKPLDALFPELAGSGGLLKAGPCLLDGEVVALDAEGRPRFQLLQNRLKGKVRPGGDGRIVYYAFDCLHLEGRDLTACALPDRKGLLEAIVPAKDPIRYSAHFEGQGKRVFREAVKFGFEGVIAKRKAGTYVKGRSADWLKIKTRLRQEVVIAGMTAPRNSRAHFGSLVAGLYRDGELVFAGHVGGGFDARLLKETHALLSPLKTKACPFRAEPKTNEKVEWLAPKAVAEVEFAEWTEDGRMRQPVFLGLRPDKRPEDCRREQAGQTGKLVAEAEAKVPEGAFTHLEKVYWPGEGYTKGHLIRYYDAVSEWILPHLKDRPLILKRFPDGIERPPFFQHDVKHAPAFLRTARVTDHDGAVVNYALCQDKRSLLYLANLGVIPMHPWLSRVPRLHQPDHIVFDLDPQEVPFPEVARMALVLGGLLEGLGLPSFPKTSGSKGIHLYVPLKPGYTFAQSLDFAQLVAAYALREAPGAFTTERSLKIRKRDRIYLDCMQNSEGKSVAGVYSVREKPGATVSAALEWAELKRGVRLEDFTLETMPRRLAKKGDLFAPVLKERHRLSGPLRKLEGFLKEDRGGRERLSRE